MPKSRALEKEKVMSKKLKISNMIKMAKPPKVKGFKNLGLSKHLRTGETVHKRVGEELGGLGHQRKKKAGGSL